MNILNSTYTFFQKNYKHKLETALKGKFGAFKQNDGSCQVPEYFQTLEGKKWYRGQDSEGNLFFATDTDLQLVIENREIFWDSTFAPVNRIKDFHQLSTLSVREVMRNGAIFAHPLIFILNRNIKNKKLKLLN